MRAAVACGVLALGACRVGAQDAGEAAAPVAAADVVATVDRGITGEHEFRVESEVLQARPQQDLNAPLLLRLDRDVQDPTLYRVYFMGTVEGEYDLRDLIEARSGADVRGLLPGMRVRIVSTLPEEPGTDLRDAADLDPSLRGGYRELVIAAVAVWAAVPVVAIGVKLSRRRPKDVVAPPEPELTLADQLRPLVEAAASRSLTTAERGRLELLLYHVWRERAGVNESDIGRAMAQVRRHPDCAPLLGAIERWLHARDGEALTEARLGELLAPYRSMAPIGEEALGGAAAREPAGRVGG